jgi:signal transduction histidine kinase
VAKKNPEPSRLACIGWSIALVAAVVLEAGTGIVLLISALLIPFRIGRWPASVALDWLRGLADLHRLWAARVMGTPIARPYRELPEPDTGARLHAYLSDPATGRDVRWLAADLTVGQVLAAIPGVGAFLSLLSVGYLVNTVARDRSQAGVLDYLGNPPDVHDHEILGLALVIILPTVTWFLAKPALRAYTWLQHWLLSPAETTRLATRIAELTRSRDDAVDTQAAEIRRIERDLHDGAQARLVALGMSLGMAEKLLAADPDAAQQLLAEAKQATGLALSELRELVRGIHPPILADRGLAGAAEALALSSPIPIELTTNLPGRPAAPVESAMYFALTEVLTNMAKHSGASSAWIRISHDAGRLWVMVGDNGTGGASMPEGGGLAGVARRLAGFDGMVNVASPIGGPTIVTMELPCQLAFALS